VIVPTSIVLHLAAVA